MSAKQLRLAAEAYADAAELRRGWLVSGEKAAAGVVRRTMRAIAQQVFDAGITLPEFLEEVAQYEEDERNG